MNRIFRRLITTNAKLFREFILQVWWSRTSELLSQSRHTRSISKGFSCCDFRLMSMTRRITERATITWDTWIKAKITSREFTASLKRLTIKDNFDCVRWIHHPIGCNKNLGNDPSQRDDQLLRFQFYRSVEQEYCAYDSCNIGDWAYHSARNGLMSAMVCNHY